MAQAKNGIATGFSGKVGSVVGYILRGKSIIRSLPAKTRKKPSSKQLAARARFALLQQWRSPLTGFFAVTFKNHTHERSAQNAAHHFNAGIVVGDYPGYQIDYGAVVISRGSLPFVEELKMEVDNEGIVTLSWLPNYLRNAKENDLMAYLICYEEPACFKEDLSAAKRSAGTCVFKLDYPEGCKTAHLYVTVLSNDREQAANSVYMGALDLQTNSQAT